MPDRLLRDLLAPGFPRSTHAPKYLPCRDATQLAPFLNLLLYPVRHGNRANVSSLADQVDNGPMIFTALNVNKIEIGELPTTQSAAQQNGQDRSVACPPQIPRIRKLPESPRLVLSQPISEANADLLGAFHATNASCQFRGSLRLKSGTWESPLLAEPAILSRSQ